MSGLSALFGDFTSAISAEVRVVLVGKRHHVLLRIEYTKSSCNVKEIIMANLSTQFSKDGQLRAREAARRGEMAGALMADPLGREPLPQSSSEELLQLLTRTGRGIPALRGMRPARLGREQSFSPELVNLLRLLDLVKKL